MLFVIYDTFYVIKKVGWYITRALYPMHRFR